MKRSTNLAWAELRVGVLLVATVLVGTVTVTFFSGIREYFRPTYAVYAILEDVAGLKKGAAVMLSGLQVGSVSELTLSSGGSRVRVDMRVYTAYQSGLHNDSAATLGSQGLLGDKYIELSPGTGESPILGAGGRVRAGVSGTDIAGVLGEAEDVTMRISKLLTEVTGLVHSMRAGAGTAGKLLTDPQLFDSARDAARAFSATAGELSDTAQSFTDLSKRLQADLLEGEGTLQQLSHNPEPFERLNSGLGRLDALLAKVEAGEGSLGRILNDDATTLELNGLLQDIRSLVQKIEREPKKYLHFTVF